MPGAELRGEPAERQVGDARHRRQDHRRVDHARPRPRSIGARPVRDSAGDVGHDSCPCIWAAYRTPAVAQCWQRHDSAARIRALRCGWPWRLPVDEPALARHGRAMQHRRHPGRRRHRQPLRRRTRRSNSCTLAGKPVIRHAAEALLGRRRPAAAGRRRGGDRRRRWPACRTCRRCRAAPRGRPASRPGWRRWRRTRPTSCWCTTRPGRSSRPAPIPALLAALRTMHRRDPGRAGRRHAEARRGRARSPRPCRAPACSARRRRRPSASPSCSPLHRAAAGAGAPPTMPRCWKQAGDAGGAGARRRGQHQADLSRGPRAAGARRWSPMLLPRVGTGFDVHAFAAGRPLMLCGVDGAARARALPATPTPMSASTRCATRSTARWPRAISAGTSRPARPPGRTPTAPASCATPPTGSPRAAAASPMPTSR